MFAELPIFRRKVTATFERKVATRARCVPRGDGYSFAEAARVDLALVRGQLLCDHKHKQSFQIEHYAKDRFAPEAVTRQSNVMERLGFAN